MPDPQNQTPSQSPAQTPTTPPAPQVDWDAAAKEFGGGSQPPAQSQTSSTDWDAAAKEFGGTAEPPQQPKDSVLDWAIGKAKDIWNNNPTINAIAKSPIGEQIKSVVTPPQDNIEKGIAYTVGTPGVEAYRTIKGLYPLGKSMVQAVVTPPQDANETSVLKLGGIEGLTAYREAKHVLDSAQTMLKSQGEDFHGAVNDFAKAANDFHNKDYRSLLEDAGAAGTRAAAASVPGGRVYTNGITNNLEAHNPGAAYDSAIAKILTGESLALGPEGAAPEAAEAPEAVEAAKTAETAQTAKAASTVQAGPSTLVDTVADAATNVGRAVNKTVQKVAGAVSSTPEAYQAKNFESANTSFLKAADPSKGSFADTKALLEKGQIQPYFVDVAKDPATADMTAPEFAKRLDARMRAENANIFSYAKAIDGTPAAQMNGLTDRVTDAIQDMFKETKGLYPKEDQEQAIQDIRDYLQDEGRDPTLWETENKRQGFNTNWNKDNTAPGAITGARKAANLKAGEVLRDAITDKFENLGVKDIRPFRQAYAQTIDARDLLNDSAKNNFISENPELLKVFEQHGLAGGAAGALRNFLDGPKVHFQNAIRGWQRSGLDPAIYPNLSDVTSPEQLAAIPAKPSVVSVASPPTVLDPKDHIASLTEQNRQLSQQLLGNPSDPMAQRAIDRMTRNDKQISLLKNLIPEEPEVEAPPLAIPPMRKISSRNPKDFISALQDNNLDIHEKLVDPEISDEYREALSNRLTSNDKQIASLKKMLPKETKPAPKLEPKEQ